jgi:hypothetical protein
MLSTLLDRPQWVRSLSILCWYVNTTSQVQVVRIINIKDWYFERTVFPGERFFFESFPEAELEVYQKLDPQNVACEKLLCHTLQVEQQVDEESL